MQKYDAIENGIANNDIKALRAAIGSISYTCRDFSDGEFDAVVQYVVEERGIKIKDDSLVGNPIISSQKTSFTDEDFADAVFELKENFCDERIDDVKTIGRKLYGNKTVSKDGSVPENVSTSAKITDRGTSPNVNSHPQKNSITPVIIGVVALMIVIVIIVLLAKR